MNVNPKGLSKKLRIAIYRTSSIGDVVLASACLDFLQKQLFEREVYWLGRQPSLELIRSSFPQVGCIEMPKNLASKELLFIIRELNSLDMIIDLQTNLRSFLFCLVLRIFFGVRVFSSRKRKFGRFFLVMKARFRGRRRDLPETVLVSEKRQYSMMLEPLYAGLSKLALIKNSADLQTVVPTLRQSQNPLNSTQQEINQRFQKATAQTWLAIAAGAAHATKRAPEEVFWGILRELHALNLSEPVGLVFLGNGEDQLVTKKLIRVVDWPYEILDYTGKLSIQDTAYTLANVSCLLSNDSALGHLAEAVNIPVAILFGPTVESFGFSPRMRQSRAFSVRLGCRPCSKHGKVACRYEDQRCFIDIPRHEVASHLRGLLQGSVTP